MWFCRLSKSRGGSWRIQAYSTTYVNMIAYVH
jgi:hypothetical protein